ncbi:MoaD/ThiS family protein [Baaleninema simplex]|uniref:MoaD/ThiS family protein n=1 Tax=Baaleninema simplex TaxID=2862350 RepID=UPI00034510AE
MTGVLDTLTTMTSRSLTITVKLFAAYQEAYGVPEVTWNFPVGTPVSAVLDRCTNDYPELQKWRELTRFGVNLQFVTPETPLRDGDEVVLIPPVSGG